ncbi:MAG: DUF1998 domain-containing protein [Thermoplasmatales archaeon]|nr:DUF1998 domain-containing protein [Thermoplasmatales archaeon]
MTAKTQHLTRSQFILTYGPGSIIESEKGPRLIPSINKGISNEILNSGNIENFEILDGRLRTALYNLGGKGSRIFALPTNARLSRAQSSGIYVTYIFPTWKVCYSMKHNHQAVLYSGMTCPKCKEQSDSAAVRFVVACTAGHMDEVPWKSVIHGNRASNCKTEFFEWESNGSSLSDILIKCPVCNAETTMQKIYETDFPCTSRQPESELPKDQLSGPPYKTQAERYREKCERRMKALQRQSSSLRSADTVTLLTVPEYDNPISNVLQRTEVASAVQTIFEIVKGITDDAFAAHIGKLTVISEEAKEVLTDYINKNSLDALKNLFVRLTDKNKKFLDFVYEEYDSLSSGEIRSGQTFSISGPISVNASRRNIPRLKVYPVPMLRTVTAQIGYHRTPYIEQVDRIGGAGNDLRISSGSRYGEFTWYPGFEGKGEGLFITVDEDSGILKGESWNTWDKDNKSISGLDRGHQYWENLPRQPLFVWFHTLSHSLIRALAHYAGYSSASIRERIYLDREFKKGGILIYTASAGEDGSMGGLVGLANMRNLEEIIGIADDKNTFCSNDPLCFESRKPPNRENGSACYSCLFTSETSCEHRNMFLDRHIITGD